MNSILSYLVQMAFPALLGALVWLIWRPWRIKRLAAHGLMSGPFREGALLLFFMFLAGLLALTLTPAGFWSSILRGERPHLPPAFQGGVNLVPVRESMALLRYYVRHGLWDAIWINFPGNIAMFLPIGFFAGLLADKPRWWKGVLSAFALSFFIEFFQLFVSRGTDIDDLILNTLGGLIGHWLFLLLRRGAPDFVKRCSKL